MSRRIAAYFGTMDAVRRADAERMQEVDGIGAEKAPVIVEQVASLAAVIDKLVAAGVTMQEPRQPEATREGPPAGRTVVVTGKMSGPLENSWPTTWPTAESREGPGDGAALRVH